MQATALRAKEGAQNFNLSAVRMWVDKAFPQCFRFTLPWLLFENHVTEVVSTQKLVEPVLTSKPTLHRVPVGWQTLVAGRYKSLEAILFASLCCVPLKLWVCLFKAGHQNTEWVYLKRRYPQTLLLAGGVCKKLLIPVSREWMAIRHKDARGRVKTTGCPLK